jgi:hypothetical protein
MATTSGDFPLNYPLSSDPVNVHGDIRYLAEDVRDALSGLDLSVIQIRVKNTSSESLPAGTPVYATGFDTLTTIAKSLPATTSPILGLLKQTLAVGSEGVVVVAGVLSGINTSGFGDPEILAGEILYVGSGGGLSTTQSGGAVGVIAKKAVEGVVIVEAKGNGTWGALKAGLA